MAVFFCPTPQEHDTHFALEHCGIIMSVFVRYFQMMRQLLYYNVLAFTTFVTKGKFISFLPFFPFFASVSPKYSFSSNSTFVSNFFLWCFFFKFTDISVEIFLFLFFILIIFFDFFSSFVSLRLHVLLFQSFGLVSAIM